MSAALGIIAVDIAIAVIVLAVCAPVRECRVAFVCARVFVWILIIAVSLWICAYFTSGISVAVIIVVNGYPESAVNWIIKLLYPLIWH